MVNCMTFPYNSCLLLLVQCKQGTDCLQQPIGVVRVHGLEEQFHPDQLLAIETNYITQTKVTHF